MTDIDILKTAMANVDRAATNPDPQSQVDQVGNALRNWRSGAHLRVKALMEENAHLESEIQKNNEIIADIERAMMGASAALTRMKV